MHVRASNGMEEMIADRHVGKRVGAHRCAVITATSNVRVGNDHIDVAIAKPRPSKVFQTLLGIFDVNSFAFGKFLAGSQGWAFRIGV